ncbi:MAG TPA: efflux RND transporter periplasmic adaptor subunit [Stellaceae bacterium]
MEQKPKRTTRRRLILSATAAALIVAGGLYSARVTRATQDETAAAPPSPAAVQVVVRTLAEQKIRVWSEFSGRLHAVDSAEIRPEVGGRIIEVMFEDGQSVKVGDTLFVIDPRPYEAAVARAEANLASTVTNAEFTKTEMERAARMLPTQTVAQRVYDERANASRAAKAAVKAAEAALKQASLDLEHAYVKAPIAGRTSRAEITVGNLVQPGPSAPLLTTIVSDQSIYADFEVDEQTYLENIRDYAIRRADERRIPVKLSAPGDKDRVYKGYIYSFDNHIDVASGTIRARAKFDNPDGALVPGMFVSVKLASGTERDVLLVPDRAVGFDQSKKFVYVVDGNNKVVYREVELGKKVLAQRIALKGMQPGDRVIVDGTQRVKPDEVVDAREETPDGPVQTSTNN